MIAFTTNAVAQSTATTTAETSAKVIKPITITKNVDMNFGNLVAIVAGGSIVLPTTAVRTGDAAILAGPDGAPTAASFTVTGETDYTYSITLPASVVLTDTVSATTMTVNAFNSTPTVAAGGTLTGGSETVFVGATLNVGALQAAGVYSNATDLVVTVNYN